MRSVYESCVDSPSVDKPLFLTKCMKIHERKISLSVKDNASPETVSNKTLSVVIYHNLLLRRYFNDCVNA